MNAHVGEEALMDLLEGSGGPKAERHVAACPGCAARLAEARELLEQARGVEVPEPPPLYWEAFRRNVKRRIAEERQPAWRGWLLPVAVALAAAVALISLPTRFARVPAAPGAGVVALPAWTPLPPAEDDEALPVLEGVAANAGETVWTAEPGLGPFLAGLTDEESRALTQALADRGQEEKL
jgi:anti-sigma factor RsiW